MKKADSSSALSNFICEFGALTTAPSTLILPLLPLLPFPYPYLTFSATALACKYSSK